MPDRFFDSSAMVKRYLEEAGAETIRGLLRTEGRAIVSRWAFVEVAGAVARRARSGGLDSDLRRRILHSIREDFDSFLTVIEINRALLDDAVQLADRHALRAGDAIQLASLRAAQVRYMTEITLLSSDRELNTAAVDEGVAFLNPEA